MFPTVLRQNEDSTLPPDLSGGLMQERKMSWLKARWWRAWARCCHDTVLLRDVVVRVERSPLKGRGHVCSAQLPGGSSPRWLQRPGPGPRGSLCSSSSQRLVLQWITLETFAACFKIPPYFWLTVSCSSSLQSTSTRSQRKKKTN